MSKQDERFLIGVLYAEEGTNKKDYSVFRQGEEISLMDEIGNLYRHKSIDVLYNGYFAPVIETLDHVKLEEETVIGLDMFSHDILSFEEPFDYDGVQIDLVEVVLVTEDVLLVYMLDENLNRLRHGFANKQLFMAEVQSHDKELVGSVFEVVEIKGKSDRYNDTMVTIAEFLEEEDKKEELSDEPVGKSVTISESPAEAPDFTVKIMKNKNVPNSFMYACHDKLHFRVDMMSVVITGAHALEGKTYTRATYSYFEFAELLKRGEVVEATPYELEKYARAVMMGDTAPVDYDEDCDGECDDCDCEDSNCDSEDVDTTPVEKAPAEKVNRRLINKEEIKCKNCNEGLHDCECEYWEMS